MKKKIMLLFLLLLVGCSQSLYMQGRKQVEEGRYNQAVDSFYKDIAANPKSSDAWRELGIAFYKMDELTKAEDAFKQAIQIHPDATAYLYLGLLNEKKEQYDAAIDAYSASLNLNPGGKTGTLIRERLDGLIAKRVKREAEQAIQNESKIEVSSIPSNTIAVVNFDGSHLPPETAPISLGLADFTAIDLGKVKSLRVVERTKIDAILNELKLSSSKYADPAYGPKMGRMLGSHSIVTGSLTGIGDKQLRLDGALVNTPDSSSKMTRPSEGDVTGFFKMQKDFVFKIIDELGITLTAAERDSIQKFPTESYLAFMAYCRGLDYRNRGMYKEAQGEFKKATSEDKNFQEAYVQFKATPSKSPEAGQPSVGQFESMVEGEIGGEGTSSTRAAQLSEIIFNSGAVPDYTINRTILKQPEIIAIDKTGTVIIRGDLDAK